MTEIKTDPRVFRTKKLIINGFIELLEEKEFRFITIKDVTDRASVNRATFYSHFSDKYNLMEEVIREGFNNTLSSRLMENNDITVELIKSVYVSLIDLQESLFEKYSCKFVSFIDIFDSVIREELYKLFYKLLEESYESSSEAINTASTLVSWSIYGAAVSCRKYKGTSVNCDVDSIVDYVVSGIKGALEVKSIGILG